MAGTSASGGDRSLGNDGFPEDGPPIAPKGLSEAEQAFWDQIIDQVPTAFLRRIDVYQLRTLCELLALKDRIAGFMKADPTDLKATRLYIATSQQVNRLSAMFGLDPVSRARLKLSPVQPDDPFTEWLNERNSN